MGIRDLLIIPDWEIRRFLSVVIAVQAAMLVTIALNYVNLGFWNLTIWIIRQAVGFIYLTFIPGMILIRILRLHQISALESMLYSVGLSIAFTMFFGLLVNSLYPSIGVIEPFSLFPLISAMTIGTLVLCVLAYLRDKGFGGQGHPSTERIPIRPVLAILLLLLLNFVGIFLASAYGMNLLLILTLAAISGLTLWVAYSKSDRIYFPLLVMAIALMLLYDYSLISRYPVGWDNNSEYFVYRLVNNGSIWNSTVPDTYNSALSITIFPEIYSQLMNIDGLWIFKIVHPFIYSLVPGGLYEVYRKQTDSKTAFLSIFFFVSLFTFFNEMPSLARQEIAVFFIVLLMLLMLDKRMDPLKKTFLYLLFGSSIIVSHYGVSYLYLVCLAIALIILFASENLVITRFWRSLRNAMTSRLTSRNHALQNNMMLESDPDGGTTTRKITLISTFFLLVVALAWYIYTSNSAAFTSMVNIGIRIYDGMSSQFMVSTTRTPSILRVFGLGSGMIIRESSRIVIYITLSFTAVGVLMLALKLQETKFNREYRAMTFANAIIVLLCVLLPYFAASLNTSRTYHFATLFLAPFCVLGGVAVFEGALNLSKYVRARLSRETRKKSAAILTTAVLVIYFLYNSGFIYEVTGDAPSSVPLSMERMKTSNATYVRVWFSSMILSDQDVASATWLSQERNETFEVYSDLYSAYHVLASYGLIPHNQIYMLLNETRTSETAYIYLSQLNVVGGTLTGPQAQSEAWNTSDIFHYLRNTNQIYSNGFSEIHLGIGQNP